MAIHAIGFVAPSGTGKTTLLRQVVALLAGRGLRLGYLKHAHHRFDLDVPGKDSHAIREAGAEQVMIASRERWALQTERRAVGGEPSLEEMLCQIDGSLDLVLVEGFKHARYPKIEVHRAARSQPFLYPDDPDILALVTDAPPTGQSHPQVIPLDRPDLVADFVLEWRAQARATSRP